MSYDLHFFKPVDGEDPHDTLRRNDEGEPPLPTPESTARKNAAVKALLASNPKLETFHPDLDALAEIHDISPEAAAERFSHVEISEPEIGNGIQIILYDHCVDMSVPYWHSGPEAEAVLREMAGYARILMEHTGFRMYDPQSDGFLESPGDILKAAGVMGDIADHLASGTLSAKKPWWKFW